MTTMDSNDKQIFVRAYTKQGFEVFTYHDYVNDLQENDVVFISIGEYGNNEIESLIINNTKNKNGKIVLMNMNDITTIDNEDYKKADALIFSNKAMLNSEFACMVNENRRFVIYPNITMNKIQSNIMNIVNKLNIFDDNDFIVKRLNTYDDTIHVAFALHDKTGNYCHNIGAVIQTIIDNSDEKCIFHILHDDTLTYDNKEKLVGTINNSNCGIDFIYIDVNKIFVESKWINKYSIGSMFRLFIPEMLIDINKVIYLDADIMFNCDIKELWDLNIENYCIGGVSDAGLRAGFELPKNVEDGAIKASDYINTGVLLMNLNRIRSKGNMLELCCEYLKNNENSKFPDQDAINYIYHDDILHIDSKYNTLVVVERGDEKNNRILKQGVVYHGNGSSLINYSKLSEYDKVFLNKKLATPWAEYVTNNEIINAFSFAYYRVDVLQKLMKKLSKKNVKHIFYGKNNLAMEKICSLITINESDYAIIPNTNISNIHGVPVKSFNDLEKEDLNNIIVFVSPETDDGQAMNKLNSLGLKINENYFAIPMILTANQGGYWR